jgi:hypothetical protein
VGILNRRNAVLGWTVWQFAKRMAEYKAKSIATKVEPESKRPNKKAVAAALLAVGAGLMFWRTKSSGDDTPPPPPPA